MELRPMHDSNGAIRQWGIWYRTDQIALVTLADDVVYQFSGASRIAQKIEKE
jgi:hypothetical protein